MAQVRFDSPGEISITRCRRDLLAGVRVLVAEDLDDLRYLIAAVLELAGADVRSVSGGREALRIITENPPDVLVSDIAMPDGDGLWLIRAVRELGIADRVPAVAVTALVDADDRRRILAAGYAAHVPKPAIADDLVLTVHGLALTKRSGRVETTSGN